jgi:hypothetical protein
MKIFYTLVFVTLIILIGGFIYNSKKIVEPWKNPNYENPDDITSSHQPNPNQEHSNFERKRT